MTGKTFRLPTEAEWEYAARGGNQSKGFIFAGSDQIDEVSWNQGNWITSDWTESDYGEQPVAQKKANELGLFDMSGNVSEWCQDWKGDYSAEPQVNPTGPDNGTYRIMRGGNWSVEATQSRVAYRASIPPTSKSGAIGLRLAL